MENNVDFKSLIPTILIGSIIALLIGHYGSVYFFMNNIGVTDYSFSFKDIGLLYDLKDSYSDNKKISDKITLFIAGGFAPLVGWFVLVFLLFFEGGRKLHGDARFANISEIKKAGFLPSPKEKTKYPPILFGKTKSGELLKYCSNEFYAVSAPTRSGKGVSIVIPNLLNYPESVVVFDVKFENFDLTSGFRSKYSKVYRFSPTSSDYRSHGYNPLDYISRDRLHIVSDIQNIAKILYPTSSPSADPFFNDQAQTLFLGLCLYSIEKKLPVNLADLLKLSTPKNGMNLQAWIAEEMKKEAGNLSIDCLDALLSFANTSDKTASSILASFQSPLNIFRDPVIASATSKSDFDLRDIRRKKMSIYVCINVGDLDKCKYLMNLFFSQLIDLNTKVLPEQDPTLKYQCLLVMDEFTSLGYMGVIEKGVSFIAGYGMRLLLIFQSRSQLKISYEKSAGTILENVNGKAIFAPNEIADAKDYSEMLGYQTVKGKSRSNQSKGGSSTTISDQRRALMLPQELKEMHPDDQIITFRGEKPIYCKKIKYYEDKMFTSRLIKVKPEIPLLNIKEEVNAINEVKKAQLYKEVEVTEVKLKSTPFSERINNEDMMKIIYSVGGVVDQETELV